MATTRRDSGVAKRLGAAALKGGGGAAKIGRVVASLAKNPIKSNFVNKAGRVASKRGKGAGGGGGG